MRTSIAFVVAGLCITPMQASERQLTSAPYGHVLTNVNVWSHDSQWIVYDVRAIDSVFDGTRIERVNARTGEVEVLYASKDGAPCGVVTYHPQEAKVVFIHGPERPAADWSYGATRRRGVIVDTTRPGIAQPLDAMNYAPPFIPGALRGGTHVHVFSPDGKWVSSTYEDEVLARLGPDGPHQRNQRTIAVAVPHPAGVRVSSSHPRNHAGEYFSVVVAKTTDKPKPGSDEISRAFEEGWVLGTDGQRSIAFIGNVVGLAGNEYPELFVLDLPEDLTRSGGAPLEGTPTTRPAPPRGVIQRRLTFTAARRYPGLATLPRHWVRCSPDGKTLACLMKDEAGIVQLWVVPVRGGDPRQVTHDASGIASAFTWSPDGSRIAHTMDGSVCVTQIESGATQRLTEPRRGADGPEALACVFSPDGRQIAYTRRVVGDGAVFAQIFTVEVRK